MSNPERISQMTAIIKAVDIRGIGLRYFGIACLPESTKGFKFRTELIGICLVIHVVSQLR